MPSPAQIIGAGVHDQSPSENALRAKQLDLVIGHGALGVALGVGFVVAEVADVTDGVGRGAVLCGVRVDCVK